MKKIASLFLLFFSLCINAQESSPEELPVNFKSIHQEQAEKYAKYNFTSDQQWDSLRFAQTGVPKKIRTKSKNTRTCNLNKRVYGWHPYWSNGLQTNYDWNSLTDLCYFDYEVNESTGNANSTHGWATAQVVTDALANGVNVTLCATMFSNHTSFLSNTSAKQTLITNLINMVQSRNAHGVNIDFEGMSASNNTAFKNFMIDLCNQMHNAIPGSEVSIALPAVEWSSVFDVVAMEPYVDLFIIMGYDYYYGGSTTAGPTDPLYNFQTVFNYNLTKSISYYLNKGVSRSKLLLGLPYYGREWSTASNAIPSSTTGSNGTVFYNELMDNTSGYYSNRQWDANSYTSYYPSLRNGQWWQAFASDEYSMSKRFDVVNMTGIGGIGIWALGYDDGYDDFWDLIQAKFSDCAVVPCTDTIFDLGGPNRNYNGNENFTYTIAPTNASNVSLNFTSFATELNFDTLYLYDGTSTSSPLLGAFHGTTSPGTVNSTGPALTMRWKSDNGNHAAGWRAIWNCSADAIAPTTQVTAPIGWATQTFTTTFTDADNNGGSGIDKSFYQVLDYNGTEWRANNTNGFFNDNFDLAIHPEWTSASGTWAINGGDLEQTDQANSNTNIYAPLIQNLSNTYLYTWSAKIDGTGTNRRAGFHFFCDNASLTNRGNSYFVWFRADQSQLQIYKVVNDVFGTPVYSAPATTTVGTWYNYAVVYDRITGKMDVFVNNILIGSWTDSAPYSTGNAISFRSGDCNYMVDDLKVYRSRTASAIVSIGAASTNDVRYQNPNPTTASGRINSISKDLAGNFSVVSSEDIDVDWTAPDAVLVSDGLATDIDTSNSLTQLTANWTASTDNHSGVVKYWYAIGTTAGATDVLNWTDNGLTTSATSTGLSLIANQLYYVSVKAENGAGISASAISSDGQMVNPNSIADQLVDYQLTVYPNPFNSSTLINYTINEPADVEILITDMLGKKLLVFANKQTQGKHTFELDAQRLQLAKGIYVIGIKTNRGEAKLKVVVQ